MSGGKFSKQGKVVERVVAAPAAPVIDAAAAVEADLISADLDSWWLPEPVAAWVDACHLAFGVPRAMAIAAALCAACTVVQGKVSVEIRPGWTEPLSLYWLVFAGTGSRKSALLKLATAPIRALQKQLEAELRPQIAEKTRERQRLEVLLRKCIQKQKPTDLWTADQQEARAAVRKCAADLEDCVVPLIPRWLYDDINPTVVPRKLRHNQTADGIARLAVLDAEGTFMANLLGRHSGHVNVDPLLKGYMGEPIDMVRSVQGQDATADTHIDAAHLTLLLLVQPHYLDEIRAKPELGANGFLGRCLMTHCAPNSAPMPWEAPSVPQDVQDGYGRWLATLAAIEAGTVYQMPAECHRELAQFHARLEADRLEGKGADGWNARTLGRICRVIALTELGTQGGTTQNEAERRRGGGGVARDRVLSKLTYLINSLYSTGLAQARLVEPPRPTLPSLSRRALHWLCSASSCVVGSVITSTLLRRGLTLSKDSAEALCDALVESGHLEQGKETRSGNKRLVTQYKVLSLEPIALERPKPVLLEVGPRAPRTPDPELDAFIDDLLAEEDS